MEIKEIKAVCLPEDLESGIVGGSSVRLHSVARM